MGLINHNGLEPEQSAIPGKVKIRCHSCGARYLVPQEAVRGRRFRVQCKQCDGVIVARCEHGSFTVLPAHDRWSPSQSPGVGRSRQPTRRPSPRSQEAGGSQLHRDASDVWYVGIAGQPHGPHTEQEIAQLLAEGEITRKSHVWQIGDKAWRRIERVELFREYLLEMQLTEIFAPDEQPPESVPQLMLSELGCAHTLEQPPQEQDDARARHDGDDEYDPPLVVDLDGYESFSAASIVRRSTEEEEATSLRARVGDRATPRPQIDRLDSSAGDGLDMILIEDAPEVDEDETSHVAPGGPADGLEKALDADAFPFESSPAAQVSAARVSGRWRRATELGMGTMSLAKVDTGAARSELSGSGVYAKRSATVAGWTGPVQLTANSRWSGVAAPPRQATLPLQDHSVQHAGESRSSLDARQQSAAGEESLSLPSWPSSPLVDGDGRDLTSTAGAKLPTEMLQLIPKKLTLRPQPESLSRPTFAPPLPEEAIPLASPSMLLERKRGFWTAGRIGLTAIAVLLLCGATVTAYWVAARAPSKSEPATSVVAASPASVSQGTVEQKPSSTPATPRAKPVAASTTGDPLLAVASALPAAVALPDDDAEMVVPSPRPAHVAEQPTQLRPRLVGKRRARRSKRRNHSQIAARPAPRRARAAARPPRSELPNNPPQRENVAPVASVVDLTRTEETGGVPDPDQILALGTMGAQERRPAAADTAAGLPQTLSKAEIKRVMGNLRPEVVACFDKHRNAGKLRLRVTVQPYGRAVAQVVGALSGTPTANCVLAKLPRIRFKRFSGDPITFSYTYMLE